MHNCVSRIYGYVGHTHILLVTCFNITKGTYLKKTKRTQNPSMCFTLQSLQIVTTVLSLDK